VEGHFGDPVSGQDVAVVAGAMGAEVVFTTVYQLFGTRRSAEGSRLAMLVWLGGWGLTLVVVS
jgi:hypothetical protein